MFQVTSSETMKCPSKEIDKNNISLLLSNHNWFISLFESPHSSCFVSSGCLVVFLQSMAVSCVSRWREVEAGGRGTLRSALGPPTPHSSFHLHTCPVWFGRVERLLAQSLPLRPWGCDVRVAALGPSAGSAVGERPPPALSCPTSQSGTAVGRSLLPARATWPLTSQHPREARWRGRVVGLFGSAPDADPQSSSRPDGSPGSTGEAWPQSSLRIGTAFLGELRPMPLPKRRPVLTEQGSKMKSENISLPCPLLPKFS